MGKESIKAAIPRKKNRGTVDKKIERRNNENFGELGIIGMIRAQRLRWLGHIQRPLPERATRRVMGQSLIGARRRGRPRKKWRQAVEDDLRKLIPRNTSNVIYVPHIYADSIA
ncbi:hypothetical protein QE152_g29721 [Popillia japonica]|uniref:Uncharacterized protein n=1 Tax=Popillia japonica TaxID=7064 RepID=A0AAW1JH23_POPJA